MLESWVALFPSFFFPMVSRFPLIDMDFVNKQRALHATLLFKNSQSIPCILSLSKVYRRLATTRVSSVPFALTHRVPVALFFLFFGTPGSFPPQGLRTCWSARALFPTSPSHHLLIHIKCLLKCHPLQEAFPGHPV